MPQFKNYRDAHREALRRACLLRRETGILAVADYEGKGFNVYNLPRKENRYGFELRCETVRPDDPPMCGEAD